MCNDICDIVKKVTIRLHLSTFEKRIYILGNVVLDKLCWKIVMVSTGIPFSIGMFNQNNMVLSNNFNTTRIAKCLLLTIITIVIYWAQFAFWLSLLNKDINPFDFGVFLTVNPEEFSSVWSWPKRDFDIRIAWLWS